MGRRARQVFRTDNVLWVRFRGPWVADNDDQGRLDVPEDLLAAAVVLVPTDSPGGQ